MTLIFEYNGADLPNNHTGNTLAAQRAINAAVVALGEQMGTEEAKAQALRVSRYLGFAPKTNRGPKPAAK